MASTATLTPPSEIASVEEPAPRKVAKAKKDEGQATKKDPTPWVLFLRHLALILPPASINGTQRMSFGSFLRKIKPIDKWEDEEILKEFASWTPPVKKEGSVASSSPEEDPSGDPSPPPSVSISDASVLQDPLLAIETLVQSLQEELDTTAREIAALLVRKKQLTEQLESSKQEFSKLKKQKADEEKAREKEEKERVAKEARERKKKEMEEKEKDKVEEKEKEMDEDASSPLSQRRKKIPKHIKTLVWSQHIGPDKATAPCCSCRKEPISIRSFHCGHVIAEAKGGDLTIANLRPICAACNGSMGTRSMNEFTKEYFGWTV